MPCVFSTARRRRSRQGVTIGAWPCHRRPRTNRSVDTRRGRQDAQCGVGSANLAVTHLSGSPSLRGTSLDHRRPSPPP